MWGGGTTVGRVVPGSTPHLLELLPLGTFHSIHGGNEVGGLGTSGTHCHLKKEGAKTQPSLASRRQRSRRAAGVRKPLLPAFCRGNLYRLGGGGRWEGVGNGYQSLQRLFLSSSSFRKGGGRELEGRGLAGEREDWEGDVETGVEGRRGERGQCWGERRAAYRRGLVDRWSQSDRRGDESTVGGAGRLHFRSGLIFTKSS